MSDPAASSAPSDNASVDQATASLSAVSVSSGSTSAPSDAATPVSPVLKPSVPNDNSASPLILAIIHNDINQAKELLAKMKTENKQSEIDHVDSAGCTALIYACQIKSLELVKKILELKPNIKIQCFGGKTAIDFVKAGIVGALRVNSAQDSILRLLEHYECTSRSEETYADHPMADVTLQLLAASDLRAEDINGKSDPYVIFDLLDEKRKVIQTFRSPVIDETLDPVWTNCSHVFSRVDRKGQLRCTVMDKDSVGTDEYLGSCSISLMVAHVPIGDQQPKSQLHRLPLDTQGTLSFSLAAKASA